MSRTVNVSAEVIRQLGYIADDDSSMEKVLDFIKKLVAKRGLPSLEENPARTKEEILAGFDRSLKELRLNQEGKLDFQSWEDFRDELQEEGYLH
ncbi:hypothetical protein [Parabacteroides sp.]